MPRIRQWSIKMDEIEQALAKTPADRLLRNKMSPFSDTIGNPLHRKLHTGDPKIEYVNLIAISLQIAQHSDLRLSGQRGLETEVPLISAKGVNLLQDNPSGPDRGPFRCKRGESVSDEIRVDEFQALHVVGQEFAGKGRFSDAIGTGNDVEIRSVLCHFTYPIGQPPGRLWLRQRPPSGGCSPQ